MSESLQGVREAPEAVENDEFDGRLATRLALGGFALMFVSGLAMWATFGPTMFVDLVTAVVACF